MLTLSFFSTNTSPTLLTLILDPKPGRTGETVFLQLCFLVVSGEGYLPPVSVFFFHPSILLPIHLSNHPSSRHILRTTCVLHPVLLSPQQT